MICELEITSGSKKNCVRISQWSDIPLKSYQRKTVLRGHEIHSRYEEIASFTFLFRRTIFLCEAFSLDGIGFNQVSTFKMKERGLQGVNLFILFNTEISMGFLNTVTIYPANFTVWNKQTIKFAGFLCLIVTVHCLCKNEVKVKEVQSTSNETKYEFQLLN